MFENNIYYEKELKNREEFRKMKGILKTLKTLNIDKKKAAEILEEELDLGTYETEILMKKFWDFI